MKESICDRGGTDAFLFTTKVDFVMKCIDIEIEKMRPGTYD